MSKFIKKTKLYFSDVFAHRDLYDEVNNPILILNSSFQILYANRYFYYFSESKKNKELTDYRNIIDFGPKLHQRLASCLQTAKTLRLRNIQGVTKSSKQVEVFFNVKVLLDKNTDKIQALLISLQDKTDELSLHAKYKTIIDKLEAASLAKDNFLASMSHELRTPLSGVIGLSQLLLDSDLNDEQRDFLLSIDNAANSLLKILNNILDFSKLKHGKEALEEIPFNLHTLLYETLHLFHSNCDSKEIDLTFEYPEKAQENFLGDPGKIRQVLHNLINNAIKFTAKGKIHLSLEIQQKNLYVISIQDNGIGIPADAQEKVFNVFEQIDNSTKRKFGGTGLGLSICKQLVELMQGELSLSSKEGQGTTFYVKIPLKPDHNLSKITSSLKNLEQKTIKTLVATSEGSDIHTLIHNFKNKNFIFEFCYSTESTIECLKSAKQDKEPFDNLIITNQIETIDAVELSHSIQHQCPENQTKLIIMTKKGNKGDSSFYSKHGFSAYLTPPFSPSILRKTMEFLRIHPSHPNIISKHTVYEKNKDNLPIEIKNGETNQMPPILIAEDTPINQKIILKVLNNAGYCPDLAVNGKEAIEFYKNTFYPIIIMDCHMPIVDGYEATKFIREIEKEQSESAFIIALTADLTKANQTKCKHVGMNDFITKPLKKDDLLPILNRKLQHYNKL